MDTKLSEIDLLQLYKKWSNGLDSFKCFFRSTNFVALKHYPDFQLNEVPDNGGEYFDFVSSQLKKYNLENTLFIIDITGAEAIRTAFFIRKAYSLFPTLIFNGVLHPFGLIGDKNYISNLIRYGMMLEDSEDIKAINKRRHLLVLDHDRFGEYTDEEMRKNFNNQYELGEDDLPSVEMLDLLGYNSVVYIYEVNEKEDITCYLEHLSENNINVDKVNIVNDNG